MSLRELFKNWVIAVITGGSVEIEDLKLELLNKVKIPKVAPNES